MEQLLLSRSQLFLLCWQGVTLTDLKEAEKTVARGVDPPPRSIQPVSPMVTLTPAERGEWGGGGAPEGVLHPRTALSEVLTRGFAVKASAVGVGPVNQQLLTNM